MELFLGSCGLQFLTLAWICTALTACRRGLQQVYSKTGKNLQSCSGHKVDRQARTGKTPWPQCATSMHLPWHATDHPCSWLAQDISTNEWLAWHHFIGTTGTCCCTQMVAECEEIAAAWPDWSQDPYLYEEEALELYVKHIRYGFSRATRRFYQDTLVGCPAGAFQSLSTPAWTQSLLSVRQRGRVVYRGTSSSFHGALDWHCQVPARTTGKFQQPMTAVGGLPESVLRWNDHLLSLRCNSCCRLPLAGSSLIQPS
jgi:hypothetical protein